MENTPKAFIDETRRLIADLGTQDWIEIYRHTKGDGGTFVLVAGLVPEPLAEQTLGNADWDFDPARQRPGCTRYGNASVAYHRFGSEEGYEPLIIERSYDGLKPNHVEISEEFRLFHNLYFDEKNRKYIKFMDDGQEVDVIRKGQDKISVRAIEVKQFLAIKEMRLALLFDTHRRYHLKLSEIGCPPDDRTIVENQFRFQCVVADSPCGDGSFVRIHGKRLIQGFDKKDSGFWPFGDSEDEEKEYTEFIVGIDGNGSELFASSDPHGGRYLAPVYFRPEVLNRYYDSPSKYSVEDGYLRCGGLWGLRMDNGNPDYVTVFLGDLGTDLPENERTYWRSFNIPPAGPMSSTAVRRSFLAEFAEPERPDLVFKNLFSVFEKQWVEKHGWRLFKPFNDNDRHCLASLRIPATSEQSEFDVQLGYLAKVLVDSLNDAELDARITGKPNQKSISKLEEYLREKGMPDSGLHIKLLRDLQCLRSAGVAHRKGREYEKISQELGLHERDSRTVFIDLLKRAIAMLNALREI